MKKRYLSNRVLYCLMFISAITWLLTPEPPLVYVILGAFSGGGTGGWLGYWIGTFGMAGWFGGVRIAWWVTSTVFGLSLGETGGLIGWFFTPGVPEIYGYLQMIYFTLILIIVTVRVNNYIQSKINVQSTISQVA